MSKFAKIIIFLVALTLAVCMLASCGSNGGGKKNDEYKNEIIDDLPRDLNFDGDTVNVFHWGSSFVTWELTSDGSSGDIVEKAVNKRNNIVEERLGLKINYIKGEVPAEVFMPVVRDEIMSGSQDYDVICGVQTTATAVAAAGAFRDLQNAKYIDYEKPYWNDMYNQALSVNEKRFMIGGDISLTTTGWSSCMFFNLERFGNYLGDVDEFYQFVDDGKWTIDALSEKCRQCYLDLNGNGVRDISDMYGMGINGRNSCTDQYAFSSGIYYSQRDENGIPYLDMKNDKVLKFVDKFLNFTYNNEGVFAFTDANQQLAEDPMTTVFEGGTLQGAVEKRAQEADFGIIPMPKLDENEETYHSWISDCTVIYAVPITEQDEKMDKVGAFLECMASETYRVCLPEYYERALKQKYVRDSWSAKMLDFVHDGATTDFVAVYHVMLNGMGEVMRVIIGYNQPYISYYDSKADATQAKLEELLKIYDENTNKGEFVPETTTALDSDEVEKLEIAANDISSGWLVIGSKYKKSGVPLPDMSDKFAYSINADNEIEVRSPDMKLPGCGGYYPIAAIISRETLPLADLSVTFHIDDGFLYEHAGDVWSSSFSVMWTDKYMTEIPQYLEAPGTNGLRESVPADTTGLAVIFMGTASTTDQNADYTYIIRYDGDGATPEIDHRLGYRFSNEVITDLSQPTTIEVKEDDTLGYVVSVNGEEIRTGKRGNDILDIDLNILKDLDEAHLTIGGEANDTNFCNFTVSTINGKPAGTFFD